MLPYSRDQGIAVTTFSALARCFFAREGGTTRTTHDLYQEYYGDDIDREIARRVREVAAHHGVTMAHVAMAWVAGNPNPNVPIVGASKTSHLDVAVAALELRLDPAERTIRGERFAHRLGEVLSARSARRMTAEALRQSHEVRTPGLDTNPWNVPLVHPVGDRLQGIVVPHDDRERQAFLRRRGKLVHREHDPAIARDRDHRPRRRADLCADGHRQGETQRTVIAGVVPAALHLHRHGKGAGIDNLR